MSRAPTICVPGVFTQIYFSQSLVGYLLVQMTGLDQAVTYDVYQSSPPFYFRNTLTFSGGAGSGGDTLLKIGPGALSVNLWVMPTTRCGMLCSSL